MTSAKPDTDRPLRGRRLSWAEYEALTGRKKPEAANDNDEKEQQWKS
ncbi:MAG: hypothetical protein ACK4P4_02935 [Allorhizobium sp.]